MNCVLGLRTNASPFTLVLDDLNQTATPLLQEFTFRAFSRNINVVYLSFESTKSRHHSSIRHIAVWGAHSAEQILSALEEALKGFKESLVIIDSLYDIISVKNIDMTVRTPFILIAIC
jgi:elongator complex protein 5